MSERNDSIDPNVNVSGRQSYFNEDAKFFKDVYIYGTLYYEFEDKGVVEIFNNANFKGDVNIDGNLDVGIVTVRKRLDVGIGGTVLRAIADTWEVDVNSLDLNDPFIDKLIRPDGVIGKAAPASVGEAKMAAMAHPNRDKTQGGIRDATSAATELARALGFGI